MDKCREAFERQKHLTLYIANLVFDEKDNRYIPNEKLIRTFEEWEWKAFSNQAYGVNLAWWSYQDCYVELEEKDKRIEELIDGFKALGEEKRLPKALATIEGEQPTYKNYFKAGWQSRQAELDQQKLLTLDSELHLDAAKEEIERLKGEVNERGKRIEVALYVLKGLKAENDLWGCDQVEVQIEILEKALRGEHE